jgi:ribonuclease D
MTKYDPMTTLLLLSSGALVMTTLVFAALWLRARERALRLALMAKPASEPRSAEMEHLVQAVDTIAAEVERISEAQRFTAQVLAERMEQEPPLVKRFAGRVSIPH